MNTVLRVANWLETWAFRILGVIVREATSFLARILRRGRFRDWRRGA